MKKCPGINGSGLYQQVFMQTLGVFLCVRLVSWSLSRRGGKKAWRGDLGERTSCCGCLRKVGGGIRHSLEKDGQLRYQTRRHSDWSWRERTFYRKDVGRVAESSIGACLELEDN